MEGKMAVPSLPLCSQAAFPSEVVRNPHVIFLCTVLGNDHCNRARHEALAARTLLAPFVVQEVDLGSYPVLASRYGACSVPTYWFWVNRTLRYRHASVLDAADLVVLAAQVADGQVSGTH